MKPMTLAEFKLDELSTPEVGVSSDLISCANLSLFYGPFKALDNINLTISRNRIFALMGPSGCGKTSLLYAMAGLLRHVVGARVHGTLHFQGMDVSDVEGMQSIRREIGFVFQKPTPFPFSIYRNMELVLKEHGVRDSRDIDQSVETALTRVGLWDEVKDRLYKPALALSGGQQQRLCIARALVLKPSVLLMDEPCSALDPISSAVIEELIADLGKNHSVVLVTHNLAQAKRLAQDAAFFWVKDGSGVLVESGATQQLFNRPQHELTAAYVTGAKG